MGVKGLDGPKPPCLALAPVRLGPAHRLPVGGQDQARAGIGQLDPVAGRLPHVEKEGPLNRVLMRARLDMDTVFKEDIGGAQDILALVGGIGDMVEPALAAAMFLAWMTWKVLNSPSVISAQVRVMNFNVSPQPSSFFLHTYSGGWGLIRLTTER